MSVWVLAGEQWVDEDKREQPHYDGASNVPLCKEAADCLVDLTDHVRFRHLAWLCAMVGLQERDCVWKVKMWSARQGVGRVGEAKTAASQHGNRVQVTATFVYSEKADMLQLTETTTCPNIASILKFAVGLCTVLDPGPVRSVNRLLLQVYKNK